MSASQVKPQLDTNQKLIKQSKTLQWIYFQFNSIIRLWQKPNVGKIELISAVE